MTKETVLSLIEGYQNYTEGKAPLHGIRQRFPVGGSIGKANRWLGFCQGILVAQGVFTLEQVKEHSRTGVVPFPKYVMPARAMSITRVLPSGYVKADKEDVYDPATWLVHSPHTGFYFPPATQEYINRLAAEGLGFVYYKPKGTT